MRGKQIIAGLVITLLGILLISPAGGSVFLRNGTEISENNVYEMLKSDPTLQFKDGVIQFFYNTHCGACHISMDFLDEYLTKYPDTPLEYHDLYNNTEGRELFEQYKKDYNRPYVGVPVVFIGDAVLEGNQAVLTNFEALAEGYSGVERQGAPVPTSGESPYSLVIGAGLIVLFVAALKLLKLL